MAKNAYVTVVYPKAIPVSGGAKSCFLLGPIRNAPPWHEDAIDILARLVRADKKKLRLHINSPKRIEDMERAFDEDSPPTAILRTCSRQREWEFETQEIAARSAGLLFWLSAPGEIKYPGKAYGAFTQTELGYWLCRASFDKSLRIAFGSDGKYNGELHTVLHDIERLAPHLLPMHTSLESLCAQSIAWAKQGALPR